MLPIRDELDLFPSAPSKQGEPRWVIHDPIRNKFFEIEWRVFEVLRRWHYGSDHHIATAVNRETSLNIDDDFIENVRNYLSSHQLLRADNKESTKLFLENIKKAKKSWLVWLLHHYLFFRVPLIKPDHFLNKTFPYVKFLFSPTILWSICITGLLGIFLLSRQWDIFFHHFVDLFSVKGILFFLIALVISKVLHEFGHAYAAKYYGCRVPIMGVAFLVMWPMLYTDTNESWKLKHRRQRFNIASAGLAVELSLAAIATLLWTLLPPGNIRDMAFVIATVTWISSLFINCNPFMRFDGYYLLSDISGIPNLHERSFNIAKWWLRETLFDLGEPAPEVFSNRTQTILIAFAFSVWIYRAIVFIGIAILVYYFFVKILGIILFAIEIVWFIGMPITKELLEWRKRKSSIIGNTRTWYSLGVLVILLVLCFLPLTGKVSSDALIESSAYNSVYSDVPGKLEKLFVEKGSTVKVGQVIARLKNHKYNYQLDQINNQIGLQLKLRNLTSVDTGLRQDSSMIIARLSKLKSEKKSIEERIGKLIILSPIEGKISEINKDLTVGQWLGVGEKFATIKKDGQAQITSYVSEENIFRLKRNGSCRFYYKGGTFPPLDCKVTNMSRASEQIMDKPILSSSAGGEITLEPNNLNLVKPRDAIYKITATTINPKIKLEQSQLGTLNLQIENKSLAGSFWRWTTATILRESGF